MGSWFYSTEYVLQNRPVRISGIVHAEDEIAAYKRAQFAGDRKAVTFTAFNKV